MNPSRKATLPKPIAGAVLLPILGIALIAAILIDWEFLRATGVSVFVLAPAILTLGYLWLGLRCAWLLIPVIALIALSDPLLAKPAATALLMAAAWLVAAAIMVVLLRSTGTVAMRRPADAAILLGSSLIAAVPMPLAGALSAESASFDVLLSYWMSTSYGFVALLPLGLLWRGPGTLRRGGEWIPVMALLGLAFAVLLYITPASWQLALVAWIALPLLLLIGLRYGAWAMVLANFVGALVMATTAVVAWNQISAPPRLERQTAAILMIVIALSIMLLVDRLRRTSRLNQTMFDQSPIATMRVRSDGDGAIRILAANRAMGAILGTAPDGLTSGLVTDWVAQRHHGELTDMLAKAAKRGEQKWNLQLEVELTRADRAIRLALVTVSTLALSGEQQTLQHHPEFTVHVEDITARREAERAVTRLEIYDSTTGLLNRKAFLDRLDAQLHRMRATRAPVTIMVMDVDDLKGVNESFGHVAGDRLLLSLAVRLGNLMDADCALARIGGDEFALIAPPGLSRDQIGVVAGSLITASAQSVDQGVAVATGVSVGVATSADDTIGSAELMRRADLALYRAKQRGRSTVEFYSETIGNQAAEVLNVRRLLGQALVEDALAVAVQPIVGLADGKTIGFEALVRLRNGDRVLNPGDFLETAREMDVLGALDAAVLRKSLQAIAEDRLPIAQVGISVNTEPQALLQPGYAHGVLEALAQSGVDPQTLTIEVIESALLSTNPIVLENVKTLRDLGVKVAIDDFGTGYSNMIQLRNLSADILKIDRSFVASMQSDPDAAAIVRAVITLAHDLGMQTVAEGVESRDQATYLAGLGCERAQGYWFGRPELLPESSGGVERIPMPRTGAAETLPTIQSEISAREQ
ncbi:MAG: EAL domain-containing protein [Actinomycetia bacterium]|nr:EAL domain-containing protein [Actinomycetes bacterium]